MHQEPSHVAARLWLDNPAISAASRSEISELIKQDNLPELKDRFYRELEFGTGGMRGVMGAGVNRMNPENIARITSALASYLKECFGNAKPISVAISFDSRHRSHEFAMKAAQVLAARGIKVYITKELRPVPVLSFMVRHFHCQAGICLTASHNPPKYNGYKVYWQDGGQIVPPHDEALVAKYLATPLSPEEGFSFDQGVQKGLIEIVGEELDRLYIEKVKTLAQHPDIRPPLRIVYTPLHGAGLIPMTKALQAFGFDDVHIVPEQAVADGNFPTVTSPNPEDREALAMGLQTLIKVKGDVLIATDPDADRLAIATRNPDGSIDHFNGNEMGSLLIDYFLSSRQEHGALNERSVVIKTIVTTEMQTAIATSYGCQIFETLTGFKWIADKIASFEKMPAQKALKYECGGEESYGFLAGDFVRDKDGISAGALACEMVAYYKSQNKSLRQALEALHIRHGYYLDHLITRTFEGEQGARKIADTLSQLRANPPRELANIPVLSCKDFQTSQSWSIKDGERIPGDRLTLPQSNVLQFNLADGSRISARPSGTEPKIKFYLSLKETVVSGDLVAARNRAASKLQTIASAVESFLE